jgi:ribose 5-phosphate isomerase
MAGTDNLKPFEAGRSGNPGGRPKIPAEVREMARAMTVEALETAGEIMRDKEQTGPARMSAVNTILDRAWGKPAQPVDGDGEGGAIKQLVEIRFVRPGDAS